MTVKVLLFASYADALGAASVDLDLPEGASVETLLERVQALSAGRPLPRALVAVNQTYAEPGLRLNASDEIALIPPVAGG